MNEHEQRAFQYRQRAEELKVIIQDVKDATCRKTLVKIAVEYDHLADIQERLAKEKGGKP